MTSALIERSNTLRHVHRVSCGPRLPWNTPPRPGGGAFMPAFWAFVYLYLDSFVICEHVCWDSNLLLNLIIFFIIVEGEATVLQRALLEKLKKKCKVKPIQCFSLSIPPPLSLSVRPPITGCQITNLHCWQLFCTGHLPSKAGTHPHTCTLTHTGTLPHTHLAWGACISVREVFLPVC